MSYEDQGEIVIADDLSPSLLQVQNVARCLVLDAINKIDLGPFPRDTAGAPDRSWLRAEYVLDGSALNELATRSRYVSVTLDPEGVQMAVLPFSEEGKTTILGTASAAEPDVESVPLVDDGQLISVDFFSFALEEAGMRIEGVESEAAPEEIEEFVEVITNPELTEISDSRIAFKYMGIGYSVVKRSLAIRDDARHVFLNRKAEEIEKNMTYDAEEHARQIAKAQQLRTEVDELNWKIAHPLRGVVKEAFQNLFSRRRTSSRSE